MVYTFLVSAYPGCPGKKPLNGCSSSNSSLCMHRNNSIIIIIIINRSCSYKLRRHVAMSSSAASYVSSQYWWRCRSHCKLQKGLFTCSNSLWLMHVRWLFIVRPAAQLKRWSHAALPGSDVFRRINNVFSCSPAAILAVSSASTSQKSTAPFFE